MIQKYALVENSGLEVLIATRRDRTLGFLAYSHTFAIAACRRTFFIQDIFVTRRERTRGIGRAMMSALAAIAQERGIDQIDWTTDPWNTKAKRFYDSMDSLLKGRRSSTGWSIPRPPRCRREAAIKRSLSRERCPIGGG